MDTPVSIEFCGYVGKFRFNCIEFQQKHYYGYLLRIEYRKFINSQSGGKMFVNEHYAMFEIIL